MIKTLIFDIGQVLITYDWSTYLSSFGFSPEKEQAIANATFLSPYWCEGDRGVWTQEQIIDAFISLAPQYGEDIRRVYAGAAKTAIRRETTIPWLGRLREQGFSLYYLSNYPEQMRYDTAAALDFVPFMDGGIFSYEVKLIKPDPAIYRALMKKYPAIVPGESVFFDDNPVNVDAARALGFHGIVVQSQEQAQRELDEILALHR